MVRLLSIRRERTFFAGANYALIMEKKMMIVLGGDEQLPTAFAYCHFFVDERTKSPTFRFSLGHYS